MASRQPCATLLVESPITSSIGASTQDGGQIVSAYLLLKGVQLTGFRIVPVELVGPGQKAERHRSNRIHSGDNLVAPFVVAGAFPLGHPVAGEGQPVGAAAHTTR